MRRDDIVSDEPTRLSRLVVPVFGNLTTSASTVLSNGSRTDLIAGVAEQDDCAVFSIDGRQDLVLGSDYIRGAGFQLYELGYLNNFDIGYYLAMANFSDIAAMGAQPIALLSVIRYPQEMSDREFDMIIRGIRAACDSVGAPNVGGDIGSAELLTLSGSAVGVVEPSCALLRSGAQPGDVLCIGGYTGLAGAAVKYFRDLQHLEQRVLDVTEERLLQAWKRPVARVSYGRILSKSRTVTSCQDSSDGLKAAIESLALASNVGFIVEEESVLVAPEIVEAAAVLDGQLMNIVFGDSVDFQLVFTVKPKGLSSLERLLNVKGLSLYPIGTATRSIDVLLRHRDQSLAELPGKPWRHAT